MLQNMKDTINTQVKTMIRFHVKIYFYGKR